METAPSACEAELRPLATLPGAHGESTAVVGDWQKVVNDARLKKVVSIALNSNRDVQK
ncbi:hypothetical protein, partial [Klebsiella pneumoniae]|uniref:hypothetical protein n=1 Tax=Klebsiella pneumoniae TaxID=573 RepID=UPI001F3329FD